MSIISRHVIPFTDLVVQIRLSKVQRDVVVVAVILFDLIQGCCQSHDLVSQVQIVQENLIVSSKGVGLELKILLILLLTVD